MATNQEVIIAALQSQLGAGYEDYSYEGLWHAYWDSLSPATAGTTFNERMLNWINGILDTSYTSLPKAMQAFADNASFYNWSSMSTIDLVTASVAQLLVSNWSSSGDGVALVFETAPAIYVKDTTTPANDTDLSLNADGLDDFSSFLTYTSPAAKNVMQADGYIKYAAHNLLTYSEDLSNAAWVVSGGSKGGSNVFNFTASASSRVYQTITATSGSFRVQFRFSTADAGKEVRIGVWDDVLSGTTTGASSDLTIDADGYIENTWTGLANFDIVGLLNSTAAAAQSVTLVSVHVHTYPADTTYLPTTTAARYALPIQYDTSNVAEGLLVEPAATNVISSSNDFSTTWLQSATGSLTITANQETGPDGETSLSLIRLTDSTSESHLLYFPSPSGDPTASSLTFSVYLKNGTQDYIALRAFMATADYATVVFDMSSGCTASLEQDGGSATLESTSVESLGDGLYRCSLTFSDSVNTSVGNVAIFTVNSATPTLDSNGGFAYAGTAADNFYAGWVQLETGTVATSLIKTFGATATRSVDNISGSDVITYSASSGTIYSKYSIDDASAGQNTFELSDGTSSNRIYHQVSPNGQIDFRYVVGTANQCDLYTNVTATDGSEHRTSSGWESDDYAASTDGGTVAVDNAGSVFTPTEFQIGGTFSATVNTPQLIKEIAYYPERLRNDYLEAITAGTTVTLWNDQEAYYAVQNETDALSLDFTDTWFKDQATSDFNGSAWVLDSGTPANDFDGVPDDLLTYTSPSIKNVLDASGNLVYAPHNLSDVSATPSSWNSAYLTDQGNGEALLEFTGASQTTYVHTGTSVTASTDARIAFTVELKGGPGESGNTIRLSSKLGGGELVVLTEDWAEYTVETVSANNGRGTIDTFGSATARTVYARKPRVYYYPADTSYVATSGSAAYALPYDHYTSGTLRGLLVEPAATNLSADSNDGTGTNWTITEGTNTPNDSASPDGTTNANSFIPNTSNVAHWIAEKVTSASTDPHTFSCYLKADGYDWVQITGSINMGFEYVNFNLSTGAQGNDNLSNATASFEDIGNGWWRCSFTRGPGAASVDTRIIIAVLSADTGSRLPSFAGDGASGILWYGHQAEVGSTPTSLIKTYGATATRAGDDISLASAATATPWDVENTVYSEFEARAVDGLNHFVYCWDGTSDSDLRITALDALESRPSATPTAQLVLENPYTPGGVNRVASRCDSGDFASSLDGGTSVTAATATTPSVTDLDIGHRGGSFQWSGHIRKLVMVPRLIIDADLESWSTTGDLPDA